MVDNSEILIEDFGERFRARQIERKELREDWKHKVTHFFAGGIILVFLFVILYQTIIFDGKINVPDFFISIVSVVVGFYFAKSLYEKC